MSPRRVLTALVIASGVAVLGAALYWYAVHAPLAFDAVIWREGDKVAFSPNTARQRMADRLVGSRILIGRSRADIEDMLGPPTETDYFRSYDLVYWLGAERGFLGIDSEWLVVRFGPSGAANEVRIIRD